MHASCPCVPVLICPPKAAVLQPQIPLLLHYHRCSQRRLGPFIDRAGIVTFMPVSGELIRSQSSALWDCITETREPQAEMDGLGQPRAEPFCRVS